MTEEWQKVGSGARGMPFEIEPGVNVWDYQWYSDGGGDVQIGDSPTGPFVYLQVRVIQVEGRRIVFATKDNGRDAYTFYRRL